MSDDYDYLSDDDSNDGFATRGYGFSDRKKRTKADDYDVIEYDPKDAGFSSRSYSNAKTKSDQTNTEFLSLFMILVSKLFLLKASRNMDRFNDMKHLLEMFIEIDIKKKTFVFKRFNEIAKYLTVENVDDFNKFMNYVNAPVWKKTLNDIVRSRDNSRDKSRGDTRTQLGKLDQFVMNDLKIHVKNNNVYNRVFHYCIQQNQMRIEDIKKVSMAKHERDYDYNDEEEEVDHHYIKKFKVSDDDELTDKQFNEVNLELNYIAEKKAYLQRIRSIEKYRKFLDQRHMSVNDMIDYDHENIKFKWDCPDLSFMKPKMERINTFQKYVVFPDREAMEQFLEEYRPNVPGAFLKKLEMNLDDIDEEELAEMHKDLERDFKDNDEENSTVKFNKLMYTDDLYCANTFFDAVNLLIYSKEETWYNQMCETRDENNEDFNPDIFVYYEQMQKYRKKLIGDKRTFHYDPVRLLDVFYDLEEEGEFGNIFQGGFILKIK